MALTPGMRLGVYEVTAHIGEGGMGQVYRARDTKLNRDVALKVLPDLFASDAERLARFTREAQTLASLNHPNIAHIHGLEESGGVRALVMELVEGDDLSQRIARGAIPLDEALPIARQIAEALEAAHEAGIIHRDLKPANIKVRSDGTVKVLDFGLAKAMEPAAGSSPSLSMSPTITTPAMTQAGVILGTPAYMSPEQARGKPVDKRTDIWAFGGILYEMLMGRAAFAGGTLTDILAAIVEREPDWSTLPSDTPPQVLHLLHRCLEKNPTRRLRDIGDARVDLDGTRTNEAPAPLPVRVLRRRLARIGAMAALTAATIVVTTLVLARQPASLRPLRLSVVAPQGTTFTQRDITGHPQFALSPDGSRLALVASVPGQRPQLWVRSLESGTAQPVAGTDDAAGPFWAPDGQALAFFARGKLKKVSLDGGSPQDLADTATDVSTGAWSPEGVIIFPSGNGGALLRVPAGGGAVAPATRLDESQNETAHRWPQFLPDGRRFIFLVSSGTPANNGVYISSIDAQLKTRILLSAASAIYAEPGYLLFEQSGTLTRQRFNAQSGVLSGEPEPMGDRVLGLRGPSYLPLSAANNGALAYWSARLAPTELLWLDRSGRRLGRVGADNVRYDNPVLSPDGTKFLVTLRESPNVTDVWRFDLSSGVPSRLTFTRGVARFAAWAPDGQYIVYSANVDGVPQLFRKAASGAGDETSIAGTGKHYALFADDWSRDGRWLLLVVAARTGFDVWLLNIDDHKAEPLLSSPTNEVQPRFSPDGRWVAYASDESGAWEIYVQGFRQTRGKWLVSSGGGSQPMWRSDGRELYYVGPDGRLFAVPVSGNQTFEAGPPRPLFQTTIPPMLAPFRTAYAVSPDGQRFLLASLLPNQEPSAITIVLNWTSDVTP